MFVPRLRRSFSGHPHPGLTAGPSHFRPFGPFDQGQCASAEGAAERPFGPFDQGQCASAEGAAGGPSGLSIRASAQAPKARSRPFGPLIRPGAREDGRDGPSGLAIRASAQAPKARGLSGLSIRASAQAPKAERYGPSGLSINASAQAPKARPSCSHSAIRASRSTPVRKRRRRGSHPAPIRPFGPLDQGQCASAEGAAVGSPGREAGVRSDAARRPEGPAQGLTSFVYHDVNPY